MVELAEHNDIIFAIGACGTGKTYTAVSLAVRALKNKENSQNNFNAPRSGAGETSVICPAI